MKLYRLCSILLLRSHLCRISNHSLLNLHNNKSSCVFSSNTKTMKTTDGTTGRCDYASMGYTPRPGGRHRLGENWILEGSYNHGGQQPDFLIDFHSSPHFSFVHEKLVKLKSLMEKQELTLWDAIDSLQDFVRDYVFPTKSHDTEEIQSLFKSYQDRQQPIPLSEYVQVHCGDCREYALLTHLSLLALNIENEFANVKLIFNESEETDHTICIIPIPLYPIAKGYEQDDLDAFEDPSSSSGTKPILEIEEWVIDSHESASNGYKLQDLMHGFSDDCSTGKTPPAFKAMTNRVSRIHELDHSPPPCLKGFRRIQMLNYPIAWEPVARNLVT